MTEKIGGLVKRATVAAIVVVAALASDGNAQQQDGMNLDEMRKKAEEMGVTIDEYLMLQEEMKDRRREDPSYQTEEPQGFDKYRQDAGALRDEQEAEMMRRLKDQTDLEQFRQAEKMRALREGRAPGEMEEERERVTPPAEEEERTKEFFLDEFMDRPRAKDLEAFGYDMFSYDNEFYEPTPDAPAPRDYVIGPGDELTISVWGETQLMHNVEVSKQGNVYVPNVGLVNVGGLTTTEAERRMFGRMSKVYSSLLSTELTQATAWMDLSAEKMRNVRVYVLGEVNAPGAYALPAMSSAFTALYYGGGPKLEGSLRNVRLLRDGEIVATIDMYDYLITGDRASDVMLRDGDAVHVPPVGPRAAVVGETRRPAIYEMKEGETFGDLIEFAGGLTFKAFHERAHIERYLPPEERAFHENGVVHADLAFHSFADFLESDYPIRDGDVATVMTADDEPVNLVTIEGKVKQPGRYAIEEGGTTIRDLLIKADTFAVGAFPRKAALIRTDDDEKKEIVAFDPTKALAGDPKHDLELRNRDEVIVMDVETFEPTRSVEIAGEVREPGVYTYFENMGLTDLIAMAGGLTDSASVAGVEIGRIERNDAREISTTHTVDLPEAYWEIERDQDFKLESHDRVNVKRDLAKVYPEGVWVTGEVAYVGKYAPIKRGERVASYLRRAGGMLETAYPEGIHVVRKNQYRMDFDTLVTRPDSMKNTTARKWEYYNDLVKEFADRVPILWEEIADDSTSEYNIALMPGDSLVVPQDPRVVYVVGEVETPVQAPYVPGKSVDYYIDRAGGYSEMADEGGAAVIKPNGAQWTTSGLFFIPDEEVPSGSVIIVPLATEKEDRTWEIVGSLLQTVASVAVLGLTLAQALN